MKFKKMDIYTDGSSLGNPGKGGWGVIFLVDGKIWELASAEDKVTNNQMELTALKEAMKILFQRDVQNYEINFYIDSKYTIDGIEKWIYSWIKNNWKKADKKPVLNKELWEAIYNLKKNLEENNKLNFIHVKAHNGDEWNERVDDLARLTAGGEKVELRKGKI